MKYPDMCIKACLQPPPHAGKVGGDGVEVPKILLLEIS